MLGVNKTSQTKSFTIDFKNVCLKTVPDESSKSDKLLLQPHISFGLFKHQQTAPPRHVSCFQTPLLFTDGSKREAQIENTPV